MLRLTQVLAVEAVDTLFHLLMLAVAMAALASSSFVTLHHNQHQLQQLAHPKSITLMATKSTLGHHLEL
jgi:hypothetical protein